MEIGDWDSRNNVRRFIDKHVYIKLNKTSTYTNLIFNFCLQPFLIYVNIKIDCDLWGVEIQEKDI